jgi:hypothetical protein
VDHWSLWLDARIIAMTLAQVLRREAVASPGRWEIGFPERFRVALQRSDLGPGGAPALIFQRAADDLARPGQAVATRCEPSFERLEADWLLM